ncbi:MAG TPA: TIGR03013 family XrtA/PEP-CTERM system glycosyltransferase [Vicinamibacterales bacterium]|jgi:sugar transferase (PEP-CTERM system associated)|nr:TIGR03013 family XrtA/PEP-CTERM system glycosyltransferase [Vicinamibacterales bacterium]
MRGPTLRGLTLVVFEAALVAAAIVAAAYLRLGSEVWPTITERHGVARILIVTGVLQACLYYADLYNLRLVSDRRELFIRMLQALAAASFALAAIYYWFPGLVIGRGVIGIAAVLVISAVLGWRIAFEWVARRVGPRERLLLVGTSPGAVELARELYERHQDLGVEIVGFVDPDPTRVGAPVINPGVIGTIEDIPSIVRARSVDRVVVSLSDARGKLPMDKLLEMKLDGVTFDHLPSVYEEYTGKIAVDNLRPSWLIFSEGFRKSRFLAFCKRAMDVVAAAIGLVIAAPVGAIVALGVKLSSPGPVFYSQRRVGLRGKIFTVWKFRTMVADAEAKTGPVWASRAGDPRITAVGGLLRRTRLDELPQLWNILKGDMSLVGPRPERPEFVTDLTQQIPYYGQRHVMRPGLTGWAQVRYTYGASTEDALQKLQYDLYYIKNFSIPLDLYIVFETIKTVVLRKGT